MLIIAMGQFYKSGLDFIGSFLKKNQPQGQDRPRGILFKKKHLQSSRG
jgi:hypothetical protein